MKNYDERTRYILEQRNIRLEKRHNIRTTITTVTAMAGAIALVVGTTVVMSKVENSDLIGQLTAGSSNGFDEFDKSATYGEYIWPLNPKFNEVSSGFDKSDWRIRIDIYDTGNIGTDVYAVKSGTVAEVYEDSSKYFIIDHGNGMQSVYYNCTEIKVKKGQTVEQGEIVAATGLQASTWFEFVMLKDGSSVNPFDYIPLPSDEYIWPLDEEFGSFYSSGEGWQIKISVLNAGERNINVYAVRSGTVAQVGAFMLNGERYYNVIIDHGDGISTFYSAFASENLEIEKGQKVKQGDIIGTTSRDVDSGVKFEIFKDGISVYPLDYISLPSGAYSNSDTVGLPDEHLFVLEDDYNTPYFNFKMPDFPHKDFVLDKVSNTLYIDKAEVFSGSQISTLYIADLNGDGYREIVANVRIGSGITDDRIIAYDIRNGELYQLADRFTYNYYTTFYNNEVGYEYRAYGSTCGVADGSGDLTLDVMTKISGYTPDLYAMRNVIGGGWDEITTTPSTLIYSYNGARIAVEFLPYSEPSAITGGNVTGGYNEVYQVGWDKIQDEDGNIVAEFWVDETLIRLTYNLNAHFRFDGELIDLAIKTFRQSTVRYDD